MLFVENIPCPRPEKQTRNSPSVKRQGVGEGEREAKEEVEKRASGGAAWPSTHLSVYRMRC